MNVKNIWTFRAAKNKYMDYVTFVSKKDICQNIAVLQRFVDIVKRKRIITKASAQSSFLSVNSNTFGSNMRTSYDANCIS